jgi:hypothetical protein
MKETTPHCPHGYAPRECPELPVRPKTGACQHMREAKYLVRIEEVPDSFTPVGREYIGVLYARRRTADGAYEWARK